MGTDKIMYCIVALILGMLLADMLKNVCGCKNVVEGQDACFGDPLGAGISCDENCASDGHKSFSYFNTNEGGYQCWCDGGGPEPCEYPTTATEENNAALNLANAEIAEKARQPLFSTGEKASAETVDEGAIEREEASKLLQVAMNVAETGINKGCCIK